MAQVSPSKIALSASRDIPFNKLLLSACNVRRIKAGVSIEQLADDIARRTLLQSITVRPVLDADGNETGMYEIPAGGRRFRALELLVKQKRLAKTAPIPCVIRTGGIAEEDSLAENVQRAPLHPLDQFRAFLALREKGQSEEEIAAAFFVSFAVVKQRLRLASVSPKLLDVYAEDGITLDQLMAFTVSGDWERQEQVWERLQSSYSKEPYVIRRQLTEGAVRASDKRARFIGEAYEAEGGSVLRDLFQGDDGGWLQDVALVERLVAEQLAREAETIRAEGWKWIEVAPDFPYGHSFGLRQLRGEEQPLTAEQEVEREALQAEYDRLEEEHAGPEDLPEEVDRRLGEIEAALAAFEDLPVSFDPAEVARAGAFVSIGSEGRLRVDRGYVRPEDELPVAQEPEINGEDGGESGGSACGEDDGSVPAVAMRASMDGQAVQAGSEAAAEPEEEDGIKPLPDRLLTELTAHRTLALRFALGDRPEIAFLAALHALCLKLFYHYALDSCLELDVKSVAFTAQAPGLNDTGTARMLTYRHQFWLASLPRQPEALWDALSLLDHLQRQSLFAHCVGLSVNAVHEAYNRRPRALAHSDVLASAVELDMVTAGWTPTVDSYLGRVTKARILQAVREARGEEAAERIAHLKKGEMAEQAEQLLAGSSWLPEKLRTQGQVFTAAADVQAPRTEPETGLPDDPEEHEADMPTGAWSVAAE
ncbi:ParB/RepB/Spo0J family partition protein [Novosphingopyxis sp.]|uniref:ParB/RepB/Spo0J family partition protein n=1 Tax=Novosphingopyxis sp. TaxID=2709690 RepID=UPI003B58B964